MKLQLRGRRGALLLLFAALITLAGCAGGSQQASWYGVAADEAIVYLAVNEQVVALDAESGAEMWSFPGETDDEMGPYFATPLVEASVVDIGGYDSEGTLSALSQGDGEEQWAELTNAPMVEGPARADGGLVVGNDAGEVYLIESETQDKRLLLTADEAIWATPRVDQANGRVYVASMDHHLYAIDLESRDTLWTFKAPGALVGTPALSDGVLFFGSLNNVFFAVDAETGDERWRFETEGWVWGGPLLDGDVVFFGDLEGKVYALNVIDGSQKWAFSAEGGVRATPLLLGDLLYVGTRDGNIYAIQAADGRQEWVQSVSSAVYSNLASAGGLVLASPLKAKVQLVALDPESGAVRWSYPPQEE